jgi:hypothetical protein
MSQSDDYRAQAKLSFEIANCLSDNNEAAGRVRESARKSLRVLTGWPIWKHSYALCPLCKLKELTNMDQTAVRHQRGNK